MKRAVPEGRKISDGGISDMPEVQVEDPHWKVGDGMCDPQGKPDYVIGQIALVETGKQDDGRSMFDIVIFTSEGVEQGRLHVVETSA